jgi:hypothetical protein
MVQNNNVLVRQPKRTNKKASITAVKSKHTFIEVEIASSREK